MEDELPAAAAALPKPKRVITPAQRAVESAQRRDRRQRAKLRLAEAAAAQVAQSQCAQARDNAIAIQAAAAQVTESQHTAAFQARDKAIATQAAAQVVLMLKGEALNAALVNAGAPPCPGSPALSSASPPCVLPHGLASSQLGGSRDMSPEISSVPNILASTLALQEKLKGLIAEKELSSVKRGERKGREKEDHMDYYLEMQKRRLEVDESNARSRAKEVDLKAKEVELGILEVDLKSKELQLGILAEENRIMMADLSIMDPATRAWFVKKQKAIIERDA